MVARVVAAEIGRYELAGSCSNGSAERFELTSLVVLSVPFRDDPCGNTNVHKRLILVLGCPLGSGRPAGRGAPSARHDWVRAVCAV
jgi:hypothetical protein